jgi:hypothetical protein
MKMCAAALALAAVVLVPASAGAGTNRPPLALTATPARVALAGSAVATIRVANAGTSPVVVDVARAGFALDLRGRPKMLARADGAASWLSVRPGRFVLPAGTSRSLAVASRLPARVEPGDHDALVLLTTRPRRGAAVSMRMRIGIVVVVRVPGHVVRRLVVRGARVRHAAGHRIVEVAVVNRGNVTETLDAGRVHVVLTRRGTTVRLRATSRELRPRTRGLVELPYRGRLSGWVTARVQIAAPPGGQPVQGVFRMRL